MRRARTAAARGVGASGRFDPASVGAPVGRSSASPAGSRSGARLGEQPRLRLVPGPLHGWQDSVGSVGAAPGRGCRGRSGVHPCTHSLPRPSMAAAATPPAHHVFGGRWGRRSDHARPYRIVASSEATPTTSPEDVVSWGQGASGTGMCHDPSPDRTSGRGMRPAPRARRPRPELALPSRVPPCKALPRHGASCRAPGGARPCGLGFLLRYRGSRAPPGVPRPWLLRRHPAMGPGRSGPVRGRVAAYGVAISARRRGSRPRPERRRARGDGAARRPHSDVSRASSSAWCSCCRRVTSGPRSPSRMLGRSYRVRPSTRWSVIRPCGKL